MTEPTNFQTKTSDVIMWNTISGIYDDYNKNAVMPPGHWQWDISFWKSLSNSNASSLCNLLNLWPNTRSIYGCAVRYERRKKRVTPKHCLTLTMLPTRFHSNLYYFLLWTNLCFENTSENGVLTPKWVCGFGWI